MEPPIEPKREDCCNSGCNPCIFDVYDKQVQLYIETGTTTVDKENAMSQLEYKQFQVIENIGICNQHKILLFKQHAPEPDKIVFWSPGEHFLVKYQTKKNCCTRAYTPLKLDQFKGDYDFAIIVRKYENGLVSSYLCNLQVGDSTLWRGPYGHYRMDSVRFCRLIMIVQGTGIAPLYSIIKHILDDEQNITKIILLYCCKCLHTVLLRDELYSLLCYWNFKYIVYCSNSNDDKLKYKEPISFKRLTVNDVLDIKPFTDKDQLLLCGSEEFMSQYEKIMLENASCVNIVKF